MAEHVDGGEGQLDVALAPVLDVPEHGEEDVHRVAGLALGAAEVAVRIMDTLVLYLDKDL